MNGAIVVFTLVFNFMVLNAAIAEEVIKIGHMPPLTGPMAQMSQEMVRSFDWAFERKEIRNNRLIMQKYLGI